MKSGKFLIKWIFLLCITVILLVMQIQLNENSLKVYRKDLRRALTNVYNKSKNSSRSYKPPTRIFCIIFTSPKKLKENRPQTVLNVWAYKV